MSKNIDAVMAAINKELKAERIIRASDAEKCLFVKRVPSGIPSLDLVMGGGVPKGRFLHFKGNKSSGKSLVAYKIGGEFQRTCRHCLQPLEYETTYDGHEISGYKVTWHEGCDKPLPMRVALVDLEKSYVASWGELLGLDNDHLVFISLETAEEVLFTVRELIGSGLVDLFILDSVAQMSDKAEQHAKIDKKSRGGSAKIVNQALRVWTSRMHSHGMRGTYDPSIILINQLRDNFDLYGPDKSPGGRGIDFYAGIEVFFRRSNWEVVKVPSKEELKVGACVDLHCRKNKTFAPERKCVYTYYFRNSDLGAKGEFNYHEQILNSAVFWGLVSKSAKGGWFTIDGNKLQGKKASIWLAENPDKTVELFEEIKKLEGIE